MEIREERSGKIVILKILGRLDSGTSGAFEERLLALFDSGDRQIIADMSHLDYISSAGLRVFLVGAKRASKDEGKLAICGMQRQVKEVFEIAGFSSLFPTYESSEEALKGIRT
jgi:anti-sigma B factor antagonist